MWRRLNTTDKGLGIISEHTHTYTHINTWLLPWTRNATFNKGDLVYSPSGKSECWYNMNASRHFDGMCRLRHTQHAHTHTQIQQWKGINNYPFDFASSVRASSSLVSYITTRLLFVRAWSCLPMLLKTDGLYNSLTFFPLFRGKFLNKKVIYQQFDLKFKYLG